MPEAPEAYIIARDINNRLEGHRILSLNGSDQDNLYLTSVTSYGKKVIFLLSDYSCLMFSLGLSGCIMFSDCPYPDTMTSRYTISFDGVDLLFLDSIGLGSVVLYESITDMPTIGPCFINDSDFTLEKFTDIIASRTRPKRISHLLVDQNVMSGIGNYIRCDALYIAGIHPNSTCTGLSNKNIKDLYNAIKEVMKSSVNNNGHTIRNYRLPNGSCGYYKPLVYGDKTASVVKIGNQKVYYSKTKQPLII